jgi:putative ABC transport system permease protein
MAASVKMRYPAMHSRRLDETKKIDRVVTDGRDCTVAVRSGRGQTPDTRASRRARGIDVGCLNGKTGSNLVRMRMFGELSDDLHYAVRQFGRFPGLTTVALLALALGVGATITVFKVVNAILVRPLPFERAGELYYLSKPTSSGVGQWLSVPEFTRWQDQNQVGASLASFTPMDFNLRGPNPEGLTVVWASRNFLPVLAIAPQLGRSFTPSDFDPESDRAALISHELWQRRYAGDPAVVGSHVDLEGPRFLSGSNGRYTIIGVLPKTFWLFYSRTDLVIPMRASAAQLEDPKQRLIATVLARWSGSPEVLRSDVAAISRRLERDSAGTESSQSVVAVTSIRDWHFGDLRPPLLFLTGIALLVVLTACANVVLVLIARTSARQRELAIRAAIGASPGRLVRQLLTESLLLSLLGGCLGLWLATGASGVMTVLIPGNVVRRLPGGLEALVIDRQVMLVALGASALSGLLSGVGSAVAFRLSRSFHLLRDAALSRSSAPGDTLQELLVVSQTAVAVALLVAGGLLLRSLDRLNGVDLGIQARPGLVVWLNMNLSRYPRDDDRVRFYRAVFEHLRGQPEVTQASGIDLPFNLEWQTIRFATGATARTESQRWPEALARAATSSYFDRHGIRVLQGRGFTDQDDAGSPNVAVVSETLADRYWSSGSPIGQRLTVRTSSDSLLTSTIIGVVSDVRSGPHAPPQPNIYRPFQQAPPPWMYVTVEGRPEQPGLLAAVRRAVWAVDPDQPLDGPSGPWTLDEWLTERMEQPRLLAAIGSALAGIALVLATTGLYGLLSFSVARRTSEFGVRMALGATPRRVVWLVLRRTCTLTALGIAVGLMAATLTSRFLGTLLFGIAPYDPPTFAAATLVFLAISALATIVPVRRATAVNPVGALRME